MPAGSQPLKVRGSQAAGEELLLSTERQLINAVHPQAVAGATLLTVSHNPVEDPVRHT